MNEDEDRLEGDDLRLADFIRSNVEPIVTEWIAFAQTRTPASDGMTELALKDHIVEILDFIADDLETTQSPSEQSKKSRGLGPTNSPIAQSAAQIHASLRLADGFDIDQMVSEYRALRASVVKQWAAHKNTLASTDIDDLTRFNEAIDQAVTESVARYTQMITHSRNLFLGILGHDLRNPLGAATMSARMMVKMGAPEERQTLLASQIVTATERGIEILDALLDVTRSAFGMEFPIQKQRLDLGALGARLVDEMRATANERSIEIAVTGDTTGEFDGARLGQVFSNLIGNAIQYSAPGSAISVAIVDRGDHVQISVHNDGEPIPPEKMTAIFQSMTRGMSASSQSGLSANLGLGLFIAKKIVTAHGGELSVTSTREAGTAFTANIPRH